ncbi:uncharacterized protein BXZ73DRAFT_104669 [Epithele typhae]|uniref:uncharacterized protein n=1 Tax=Epithele typhae TaxID=378194 RepID=UPI002007F3E6|nr:uncharacterized protein BXZ73DRAFT_104669 [Epithele typhae]KAH9920543.1 hypothetical protein BXZ73DRAFT_104669 [Epithele typhae]
MVHATLLVAALLPLAAHAANDWTKPCFGECNWDIDTDTGSGTVRLVGSSNGISDITTAAGWEILDCNATATNQDIRLVCADESAGCDHLAQNGAAGTIVRLPKSCGSMPFAVVGREWTHANQTIPSTLAKRIARRDGSKPTVKGIALSTDFASLDSNTHGNVSFFIQGASVPGHAKTFAVEPPTGSGDLAKRGLFDWVTDTLSNLNTFDKNVTNSSPINFEKNSPLFDTSIDCPAVGSIPAFSGSAHVDIDGKVDGNVNYGVALAGSIVPPSVDKFGLFVNLDTTVTGTVNLAASLAGSIGTGKISLFQVGIPGLDVPEIFSLGPTFEVFGSADVTLDANVNTAVDIDYTVSGAQLFFPPGTGNGGGSFVPGDSNVKLSASPDVTSNGKLEAHLIPTLAFGVNLLAGKAKANINLAVDGNAAVDLSLSASATKSTDATANTSDFGGCVDITSGLDVSAGADGSLFSLFNKDASVSLFSKNFDLFKKCFGSSAARRAYTGRSALAAMVQKRAALTCPTTALASAASVVEEKVLAAAIKK